MLRLLIPFIFLLACGTWLPALAQPMTLADSVTYWDNAGEFHKALEVSRRWAKKAAKEAGPESIEYANALYQVGLFQYELSLPEAQQTSEEVFALRKKLYAKPVLELAKSQNLIGIICKQNGNASEYEYWSNEAAKTMRDAHLESNPFYGTVLNNLGTIYFAANNLDKALEFYSASVRAYQQNPDTTDLRYLIAKLNIAYIQYARGNYEVAIKEYKEILQTRDRRGLENHPDNATALEFLIRSELEAGKFKDGEKYLAQLLKIRKETQGENSAQYANALNLLSDYFIAIGYLDKAEQYTSQAEKILKSHRLTQTNEYAEVLHNRGRMATLRGNYAEAIRFAREAGQLYKQLYGEVSENYQVSLNNMAENYELLGQYQLALRYYRYVLTGFEQLHRKSVFAPLNMGNVLRKMGRYAEAESRIAEALKLAETKYGPGSPEHILAESRMALVFQDLGKTELAEKWFLRMNEHRLTQVQKYFSLFSETEKEAFYKRVSEDLAQFHSFCLERADANPAILDQMYNNQLATKAMLLNSSAKWKQRIKSSHDRKLLLKFTEWEEYRNRLNRLYQSADSTDRRGIDSLEDKTARLEKELSVRSEHFAELTEKRIYTWKDVQARLKPGEAAVEMVRIRTYGVARLVTDTSDPAKTTYREKGLTDTILYVALVVKPGMVHPQRVVLPQGNLLEGKYLHRYTNLIRSKSLDESSYGAFWRKIADQVKDCRRIYLSPDGVFHQINLSTLYNPATKKYLLEEKDVRLVTVTKDLLEPRRQEHENKLAYLYGNPAYYSKLEAHALAMNTSRKGPALEYRLDLDSLQTLADLPATKTEVNRIADLLYAKGWEVQNYLQDRAQEETLKEMYKPRVLHIATHGYFQNDTLRNPLLRSGLMLAGAGNSLKGDSKNEGDDGILTAYEAMNLNLDNTDLVVLSACETGLGEIKNGEGVYGLQRAFKVAGAKTIIMSLWKVDDEATQELMVSFYKHWLSSDARPVRFSKPYRSLSKREAFLAAQKELKAKYPNPYYWGAFVMVGE